MTKRILYFSLFPLLSLLWSCNSRPSGVADSNISGREMMPILPAPVRLAPDTTILLLEDFFMDATLVDTFQLPGQISGQWSVDRTAIQLLNIQRPPLCSNLKITGDGHSFDIPLYGPTHEIVSFSLPDKGYESVEMKGDMNAWNAASAPFVRNGSDWSFSFSLPPGRYQYLYVVDGEELQDPSNPVLVSNGIGGYNSLLVVGPTDDAPPAPTLYTSENEKEVIRLGSTGEITEVLPYWEHSLIHAKRLENGFYEIEIPQDASSMQRSVLRVFGYGPHGRTNDLMIPLQNRGVVTDAATLNRFDKEAQIMYFPLMDRFNNGNPENDEPVDDPGLSEKTNFQGGDIAGITQKIADGYLDSLHVNALWLSPITQNPTDAWQEWPQPRRWYSGYHGYWPVRSTAVDYRFGTNQELHQLVDVAHSRDMNVYLDYVCNHVHQEHPLYQEHPEWATPLYLEDSTMNIRIWDEQRLTTWFDHFLPSLDLSNPEVVEVQTDSTMYWILEFGLDGFRHDATKHINTGFWRTLTRKLKEQVVIGQNRPIYQIGETYGSRELISRYIGSGLLDAQFDFSLYFEVRDIFAKQDPSFEGVKNALQESFSWFGHHSSMGYITGNHDQSRFVSLAGGALKFDESSIEAGFSRDVGVGNPVGYKRLRMLAGFLFSIPGVPVIFYGDEIGMPGAGDPDNRRMMRFEGLEPEEQQTLETFRRLSGLRSNNMALTYGDTEILQCETSTLALGRTYFDQLAVAVFNKDDQPATIAVELPERFSNTELIPHFNGSVTKTGQLLTVEVAPNSFELLTNK